MAPDSTRSFIFWTTDMWRMLWPRYSVAFFSAAARRMPSHASVVIAMGFSR
jgi:hypothetical protein